MLVFLDIDGVLRRKQAPLYRLEASLLNVFVALLREYPEVSVVLTSSWTDAFSLDEIRAHFPPDIRPRIIGRTPRHQGNDDYQRHAEVLNYFRRAGTDGPWVAVDDDALNFPPAAPVLLVDSSMGLDERAAEALRSRFEGWSGGGTT